MQEYKKVKPEELKNHGKLVSNTLYLNEGVHCNDRKPDPKNELFLKVKNTNPYEKRIIQ